MVCAFAARYLISQYSPFTIWCENCSEASGTRALGDFMRVMYTNDVWLPSSVANQLVLSGEHFFNAYTCLASMSHQLAEPRYSLVPKLHFFHEVLYEVKYQCKTLQARWCLNPIVESCSVDEDFVGRLAFVTRHVSPRLITRRSLERYAVQISLLWAR